MSTFTAATGQLWIETNDFVRKGICGAKDRDGYVTGYLITKGDYGENFTPARRTALACVGTVCGWVGPRCFSLSAMKTLGLMLGLLQLRVAVQMMQFWPTETSTLTPSEAFTLLG